MKVVIETEKYEVSEQGYAAVDVVIFEKDFAECDTMPPDAAVGVTTTPPPPVLHDCDFEDDLCGWETVGPQEFVFKRAKGKNQDGVNGPDADHEGGKNSKKNLLSI